MTMASSRPRKIPLTRGMTALVDPSDFLWAGKLNWCAQSTGGGRFYAARRVAGRISLLHREIMQAGSGQTVDHINSNKLDNRRANLRFVNSSQNASNSQKTRHPCSSRFKGVCFVPQLNKTNPWLAYIGSATGTNKRKYLGYFSEETAAARAYDGAAVEMFGQHAGLNFPV